ncbi:MAG: hypothetical protein U0Q12_08655 [Vicinamibacterales bacterium]
MLAVHPHFQTLRRLGLANHATLTTSAVSPVVGAELRHARAAVDWLLQAQAATRSPAVSAGYFPENATLPGWGPFDLTATASSALAFLTYTAEVVDPTARTSALDMVTWLGRTALGLQPGDHRIPGLDWMLSGLTGAYAVTRQPATLEAARHVVEIVSAHSPMAAGTTPSHDGRLAWALASYSQLACEPAVAALASLVADRAVERMPAASLPSSDRGRTTRGDQLRGVLEASAVLGRPDLAAAAASGLARAARDGELDPLSRDRAGAPVDRPVSSLDRLDLAVVAFRLAELGIDLTFLDAAHRAVDHAKGLQILERVPLEVRGAVPDVAPFVAGQPLGWSAMAAGRLVEALVLQRRATR